MALSKREFVRLRGAKLTRLECVGAAAVASCKRGAGGGLCFSVRGQGQRRQRPRPMLGGHRSRLRPRREWAAVTPPVRADSVAAGPPSGRRVSGGRSLLSVGERGEGGCGWGTTSSEEGRATATPGVQEDSGGGWGGESPACGSLFAGALRHNSCLSKVPLFARALSWPAFYASQLVPSLPGLHCLQARLACASSCSRILAHASNKERALYFSIVLFDARTCVHFP